MAPDMTRSISILAQLYCAPCGFLIRKKLFNSKMNCTFDAGSVENFGMADKVEKGDFFFVDVVIFIRHFLRINFLFVFLRPPISCKMPM